MANGRSNIIISIFGTSSGIGKTITAINLAAGLTKEGYNVCLVDLDLQFGDIANYLKMEPRYTITSAHLQKDSEDFNIVNFLSEYRYSGSAGEVKFSVLASPRMIFDAYIIDVEFIERIIKQLYDFEFVILDLSAVFSALNLAMLDLSTVINFIGVIDYLPSVKNFKIGYDTLIRFEYEDSKIWLIENRSTAEKLIHGDDVQRIVGTDFFHKLPNDFIATRKSIVEGCPLMFAAPNSPLTKSFAELAAKYARRQRGIDEPQQQDTVEEIQGFFSRLIGKFRRNDKGR
ncbi:MAG: AAA family ATPase [Selenomonadaceae bacterium]|nr:AAA family ATPase [Selenomonadaceae bacterium]